MIYSVLSFVHSWPVTHEPTGHRLDLSLTLHSIFFCKTHSNPISFRYTGIHRCLWRAVLCLYQWWGNWGMDSLHPLPKVILHCRNRRGPGQPMSCMRQHTERYKRWVVRIEMAEVGSKREAGEKKLKRGQWRGKRPLEPQGFENWRMDLSSRKVGWLLLVTTREGTFLHSKSRSARSAGDWSHKHSVMTMVSDSSSSLPSREECKGPCSFSHECNIFGATSGLAMKQLSMLSSESCLVLLLTWTLLVYQATKTSNCSAQVSTVQHSTGWASAGAISMSDHRKTTNCLRGSGYE